jgi:uncharacterized membrane protein
MENKDFIRLFLDHGQFGYRKMKRFYLIAGSISLPLAIFIYYKNQEFTFGVLQFGFLGLFMLFQALVTLAPANAPRIEIYEDKVLIKQKAFQEAKYFSWNNINTLHLWSYQVAFTLVDGNHYTLDINTRNPDISKKIKAFLRQLAMQKSITIDG